MPLSPRSCAAASRADEPLPPLTPRDEVAPHARAKRDATERERALGHLAAALASRNNRGGVVAALAVDDARDDDDDVPRPTWQKAKPPRLRQAPPPANDEVAATAPGPVDVLLRAIMNC